jgi:hypothetical protein
VALADRVMLYGSNRQLLALYQRLEGQETRGSYLLSEEEGNRYLPMDDLDIQTEITQRGNNVNIQYKSQQLPQTPLPPGVNAMYEDDIPDTIIFLLFQEDDRLGVKIIAPIYRRDEKIGILVGDVFYTQEMVTEYASLSKTDVNFFVEGQWSIGTLPEQTELLAVEMESMAACNDVFSQQQQIELIPVIQKNQEYYQGRCGLSTAGTTIGAITVSLSQDIEKQEIRKIVRGADMLYLCHFHTFSTFSWFFWGYTLLGGTFKS